MKFNLTIESVRRNKKNNFFSYGLFLIIIKNTHFKLQVGINNKSQPKNNNNNK